MLIERKRLQCIESFGRSQGRGSHNISEGMDVPRKGVLFPQFVWNGDMLHQKEFKTYVHA